VQLPLEVRHNASLLLQLALERRHVRAHATRVLALRLELRLSSLRGGGGGAARLVQTNRLARLLLEEFSHAGGVLVALGRHRAALLDLLTRLLELLLLLPPLPLVLSPRRLGRRLQLRVRVGHERSLAHDVGAGLQELGLHVVQLPLQRRMLGAELVQRRGGRQL
jgi:hypothetical protein